MNDLKIEASGLKCPQPIILLARRIIELEIGETITLIADDPAAAYDVPAWCRMSNQELVSKTDFTFVIRRIT
ncbi:MAG TPA: sulfurtransferase TusA family protein [Candidatus Nanopelagicaceae bacterium]|nr:sulfurtransferase TusA family protein [Candidatus Nanopelagicaceae bacterium]